MSHRLLPSSVLRAALAICALWCALLPGGGLVAQPVAPAPPRWSRFSDVVFRHFTADTGLPFTGATAIAQDHHGFLWIGSQNGLARWDGQRFRLYRADRRSGLRDNMIKVLHVDARGRLWVGMNAGGMARYDPAVDRFVAYGAGPHGLSHAGVRAIADDARGGLWVATSGGLDRIDPDARTIRRYRHDAGDPASLPADHVSALLPAADGRLWVGTRAGLSQLDPATGRFRPVALPLRDGRDQPGITALAGDARGFWIGTVGAGAFRYDPAQGAAAVVADEGGQNVLATRTVTTIADAGAGQVWLATAGKGVVIVDAAGGSVRRIVHDAGVPSSLADDAPVALFRDRGGALWVGTQRALSRTDPTRTGVWTLYGGTGRPGTLSNQDVTAVHATADGRVWVGLRSNGVEILDPSRGTVTRMPGRGILPPAPIAAFAGLPDGGMAIGTNAGLFASDAAGRTIRVLDRGGRKGAREVTALLREGSTLWIGRLDGLWRLTLDGTRAGRSVRVPESDRLGDQRVMAITRAPDGTLWIGTQNGLNRLVPGSGTAQPVALTGTGSDGLVPTVLADRQGRIWAGVYGHGIAVIEQPRRTAPTIRHIDVAQGLPDANVDMLMEGADGRIWASTDGGLAMIDPAAATVRALGAKDGAAIDSYWSGSGTRTAVGQLIFGGLGGATIVDPRQVAAPRAPAPLVVTELRAGGKALPEAAFNDAAAHRVMTIAPEANSLFVEFATLDYADPRSARYRYRLRGYDGDWIDADAAHRSAAYTNLRPGEYVLEVRAAPAAGGAAYRLDIPVAVLPAWYQTLWFKLGLGALALGAVFAVTQLRTAVLKRRQRELERLVADRTVALRASQRELEQIAYIDVLTGLPNRRMFNDTLRSTLERADRRGTSAALLLIDLDRFKAINDTHGHDAGDALLSEVALRLQSVVGEYDSLARLGGDEFAIIVHDAGDVARIDDLCRRITAALAEPVPFAGLTIRSGGSIGIARYPHDGATAAELYKASDLALYAAKKRRRGSWAWHGEEPAMLAPSGGPSANRRSVR